MKMDSSLIIFGAGASYASQSGLCPSLSENLLEELIGFSFEWASLPEDIIYFFSDNIESGMDKLLKENCERFVPLQWGMARYFHGFDLHSDSLYLKLLCRIADKQAWQTNLATLNYDRLLHTAILLSGVPWFTGKSYEMEQAIEICYPHGACIWGSADIHLKSGGSFFLEASAIINCTVNILNYCQFNKLANDPYVNLPPVMSAFVPEKISQVGNSFIMEQRERYAMLVSQSRRIVIVGIQPRESDTHIWDPLKNSSANLLYVTKGDVGDGFKKWKSSRTSEGDTHVIRSGFGESFCDILSFLEL